MNLVNKILATIIIIFLSGFVLCGISGDKTISENFGDCLVPDFMEHNQLRKDKVDKDTVDYEKHVEEQAEEQ